MHIYIYICVCVCVCVCIYVCVCVCVYIYIYMHAHMQIYFLNSQFYLSDLQLHFTVLSCTAFQTKSKSAFSAGSE